MTQKAWRGVRWAILTRVVVATFANWSAWSVAGPPLLEEPAEFLPENQFFSLAAPEQQGHFNRFTGQYSLHPVDLQGVSTRHQLQRIRDSSNPSGAFGKGWLLNWEISPDRTGTQPVVTEGSLTTVFQADPVEAGVFWSHHGDQLRLQLGIVTDPFGYRTTCGYGGDRTLASETNAEGNLTRYEYDGEGSLLEPLDPLGKTSRREDDDTNRLNAVVMTSGRKVALGLDKIGRLISATDDRDATTKFTWDKMKAFEAFSARHRRSSWELDRMNSFSASGTMRQTL